MMDSQLIGYKSDCTNSLHMLTTRSERVRLEGHGEVNEAMCLVGY